MGKVVNSNYYGKIEVENNTPIKYLTDKEFKEGKQGYLLLPYILGEPTEERSQKYDEFMEEYHKQHRCCPKCGDKIHSTTLIGYIFNSDKPDEYMDKNICECVNCGDKHLTHDRVIETEKTNTVLDSLKEYFANNTREQIEKDWKETEKWDKVGPTVKEFMENNLFCMKIKSQNFNK